jgi:hypothetical protein
MSKIIKVNFKCKTKEGIKNIIVSAKNFTDAVFALECLYGIKDDGSILDFNYISNGGNKND